MCGSHSAPEHDDPAASALCDVYHRFDRSDLPLLERALGDRDREIVWQVAMGIGPDALARRLSTPVADVQAEMRDLATRLEALEPRSA